MPRYDELSEVVNYPDPLPPCRTCGGAISSRLVAVQFWAREPDPEEPQRWRWYCSAACQATGQEKP